jgi:hypothetical protein
MDPGDLHRLDGSEADDEEARLAAALVEVPRGTIVVAGTAVLLLMIGWFIIYIGVFLPRGSVG